MSRSLFKGPFFIKQSSLKKKKLKQVQPQVVILPTDINQIFEIYNGKIFVKIKVNDKMVGSKFGEFIRTRKICKHKKNG